MRYIESPSLDPYFNLALEHYVFESLDQACGWFMLWRNARCVVVGKHQNALGEINAAFVEHAAIPVARRLSGGGAVYHDPGNINFSFIVPGDIAGFDPAALCAPLLRALAACGIQAELTGRKDLCLHGKKFSGSAQYCRRGRLLHHGTLLYDADLDSLRAALRPAHEEWTSNAVRSVPASVTNLREHLPEPVDTERFMARLRAHMCAHSLGEPYALTPHDMHAVHTLRDARYATWEWIYGESPDYEWKKIRPAARGLPLAVSMRVRRGLIETIAFAGEGLAANARQTLAAALTGKRPDPRVLRPVLTAPEISHHLEDMSVDAFLRLLTC